MDWFQDTKTVLALRPRGAVRQSAPTDPNGWEWTSKYGSIVALMYGVVAVDGLNEVGLQVSGLYLVESDYGVRDVARPGIDLENFIQFFLDSFSTAAEAAAWIESSDMQLIEVSLGGKPGTGHIALADPTGDSVIIEFLDGKAVVHHGPEYTVMTNSPPYDEQLQLRERYLGLGGDLPLPGGTDSPDRFARATFYSEHLPATGDPRIAAASVLSVMRNASAPFGTVDPTRPNISTTLWRTVADLSRLVYFYESSLSPSLVWVSFADVSFESGPELLLDLVTEPDRAGNQAASFVVA
jgi:penicillin V acylase-like amidase (Ntn superfamily)